MEAELAKLFASEKAWLVADELLQIRGGRGYETAESAAARGERGVPVEQLLRDLRIGRIFDGSTEALRGFIAHEALAGVDAAGPRAGSAGPSPRRRSAPLAQHLRFVDAGPAAAWRSTCCTAGRGGRDGLEERQLFLGRSWTSRPSCTR